MKVASVATTPVENGNKSGSGSQNAPVIPPNESITALKEPCRTGFPLEKKDTGVKYFIPCLLEVNSYEHVGYGMRLFVTVVVIMWIMTLELVMYGC